MTLQVPIISMPNCLSAFHALLCYHSLPLNRGAMPLSSGGSYPPVVIIKCRCFGQPRPQEDQDCTNRQTKALDWRDYQVIRKGLGPLTAHSSVGKPEITSTITHISYAKLSRFSRVRLCATPGTAAHQTPPSLGFSRQEHWSGLPFPSPMHESEK